MYQETIELLNSHLEEAGSLLPSGNFEGARVQMDKARILRSQINRQHAHTRQFSPENWMQHLDITGSEAPAYLSALRRSNELWQRIYSWLGTVVKSLDYQELLLSSDGVNLLLDLQLPAVWDFRNDIIVLLGPDSDRFIDPLIGRGQSQIIMVVDDGAEDRGPVTHRDEGVVILTVNRSSMLTPEQLEALNQNPPPEFHGVVSGEDHDPETEITRIARLVFKEHIREFGARKWPIIFTEQLIENLPLICRMRSVSDLAQLFCGENILIVSPGPSLLNTIPRIKEAKDNFLLVALVRSLPVLLEYSIIPDFAILIDAQDHTAEGLGLIPDHPKLREVPLLVSEYCHGTSLTANFKDFFLVPQPHLIGSDLSSAIHGRSPVEANGTSVATIAATLVAELGAKSITLVGQDLCVANGAYASQDHHPDTIINHELTCTGIDGSKLVTKPDYLLYKSEFESIARFYRGRVELYNCTHSGAYLAGWKHIPLSASHPASCDQRSLSQQSRSEILDKASKSISPIGCEPVREAIRNEVKTLERVQYLAKQIVGELRRLIDMNSNDVTVLETLEQEALAAMGGSTGQGSFVTFYSAPAKFAAEASLKSVETLVDNYVISIDYYRAIVSATERLTARLQVALQVIGDT